MALLTDLIRVDLQDGSKTVLQAKLLQQVAENLADDEMPVVDAGFKLKTLFQAGLERFILRLVKNFTARRNFLPEYEGGRPSEYGDIVRPLARSYDGNQIPATPPDRVETWQHHGLDFRAAFWDDLVLRECKSSQENRTFTVAAVYDPCFENPWLLACPLRLSGADFWGFYRDRWPIDGFQTHGWRSTPICLCRRELLSFTRVIHVGRFHSGLFGGNAAYHPHWLLGS